MSCPWCQLSVNPFGFNLRFSEHFERTCCCMLQGARLPPAPLLLTGASPQLSVSSSLGRLAGVGVGFGQSILSPKSPQLIQRHPGQSNVPAAAGFRFCKGIPADEGCALQVK